MNENDFPETEGELMAWSGGSYPLVGAVTGLVYALGMIAIWFLPEPAE